MVPEAALHHFDVIPYPKQGHGITATKVMPSCIRQNKRRYNSLVVVVNCIYRFPCDALLSLCILSVLLNYNLQDIRVGYAEQHHKITNGYRVEIRCNMAANSARVRIPFGSKRLFSLPVIRPDACILFTAAAACALMDAASA